MQKKKASLNLVDLLSAYLARLGEEWRNRPPAVQHYVEARISLERKFAGLGHSETSSSLLPSEALHDSSKAYARRAHRGKFSRKLIESQ